MDKSFFPYGTKSEDFLIKRTIYLCNYLAKMKVDLIILACNTLSLVALNRVKPYFKTKIIGVFELFSFKRHSLFIGTKNTLKYIKKKNLELTLFDGTDIIEAVENNLDYKSIIKKNEKLFNSFSHIYLGCTHLIKIKELFNDYVSQDELFCIKMKDSL